MSRQSVTVALCQSAALLMTAAPAIADDVNPEVFVSGILGKEIDGDTLARRDKVIFSDGKQIEGDCGCSVPREMWLPDENVIIVSSWSSLGVKKATKTEAVVAIRFRTIARGELTELGKSLEYPGSKQIIFVPRNAYDETVSYRVRKTKDGWRLVDPPLPRVSTKAVRDQLAIEKEGELQSANSWRNDGDVLHVKLSEISMKYLEAKEATLNYLDAAYGK